MQLLARQFDLFNGGPLVRVTTAAPAIRSKPVDLRRRRDLLKIIEKARQMAADGSGRVPRYLEAVPHDAAARVVAT